MIFQTAVSFLGLLALVPASMPEPFDFGRDLEIDAGWGGLRPTWDPLSREVIAGILARVEDASSLARHARAASATIDYSMWTEWALYPVRARIRCAWDDADGSGTIEAHELQTELAGASTPSAWPLLWDLRERLRLQTALSGERFFSLHDARTAKVPGGYRIRLEPPWDWWLRRLLGYDVLYLTVGEDFRPIRAQARCIDGSGWVSELRHVRRGEKWLAAGYKKVTTSWGSRIEEDRRDEYGELDGLPVLRRVSIRTSIFSVAGLLSTRQDLTFGEWRIAKRSSPLPEAGRDPGPGGSPDRDGPIREDLLPDPGAGGAQPPPGRNPPIEVRHQPGLPPAQARSSLAARRRRPRIAAAAADRARKIHPRPAEPRRSSPAPNRSP